MFKKAPDIDRKKLLAKALDVKKDSLIRLKHFKTLIEHLGFNDLPTLFKQHFSFIYHTFIDTFSTFDCNSKQRRDDLDCILFMLEKILIFNPDLIKKRWQFYSITFVMQKLLHQNNTWQLRQEGVRLFVLWYQILCDETNPELQTMFASIVYGLVPQSSLAVVPNPSNQQQQYQNHQQSPTNQQQYLHSKAQRDAQTASQLPIKLCSIDPLVPVSSNDQLLNDEISFYLDCLLQFMVTQTTKPFWSSTDDARKNQELGFSFVFNMFKKIYLQHLFPNINLHRPKSPSSIPSFYKYVDEVSDPCQTPNRGSKNGNNNLAISPISKRDPLQIDLQRSNFVSAPSSISSDSDRTISLSNYQAIVIKWLTRILRQDMIPGQDEFIRAGGSAERTLTNNNVKDSSSQDHKAMLANESSSGSTFNGIETTSREMEIARRVIGTWPENIEIIHELFRRAFLDYHQPASMKRVVNVYKEWICNGGPNHQANLHYGKSTKFGYTSFNDLLQVFILNSSSAFVTRLHNPGMLDEQVEMCKRIMNIYRYMVMKIYMNTSTWEQLINVMLSITEHLFPIIPPEKKENTIGGRIAPAFFQTFIVSWIRANLYVHISSQMWIEFHRVMKSLVCWRELVEEWRTTMGSLTRVLVKHVYGLSLTDLPLDRPQERRRRPKAAKSFSTAETVPTNSSPSTHHEAHDESSLTKQQNATSQVDKQSQPAATVAVTTTRTSRSGSVRLPATLNNCRDLNRALKRSNSYGILFVDAQLYYSSIKSDCNRDSNGKERGQYKLLRRIKSECLFNSNLTLYSDGRDSNSCTNTDVIDGASLKDSNLIIEHDHHAIESQQQPIVKTPTTPGLVAKSSSEKPELKLLADKCVLLGGSTRGWTSENSVIMWRRMLGLFGNINHIENPENHLVAIKCLESITNDFIKTRDNLGVSLDNQSTPSDPNLIPPYTYSNAWLLESTHLPLFYRESRIKAYELLCLTSIRRHDTELPSQYYVAFYEAIHRGLTCTDYEIYATIIKNSTQLLPLELPGSTILVQQLFEQSRSIVLSNNSKSNSNSSSTPVSIVPHDEAIQILSIILALSRPIKKLMVIKSESVNNNNTMSLVTPGDIKTKVFETLLACNTRPLILDNQTRCKSICSMASYIYQELCDKTDSLDVERFFDILLIELHDTSNRDMFRTNCDLLRLFSDHAKLLASSRHILVSSIIQVICQLIVRLSVDETNKDRIHSLLICLEDWCLAVGKRYLLMPLGQLSAEQERDNNDDNDEDDDALAIGSQDSLITIILRSLDNVINDEQYIDDSSNRGGGGGGASRTSISTTKGSDTHSNGRNSQTGKQSNSDHPKEFAHQQNNNNNMGSRLSHHQNMHPDDTNLFPNRLPSSKNLAAIKLACKVSHHKLITYLGHFPLRQVGAASMSCCVNEADYLLTNNREQQDLIDLNNTPGVFFLVVDNTTIISFIGANKSSSHIETSGGDVGSQSSVDGTRPMHMIVRNLCGKYSWDISCVEYSLNQASGNPRRDSIVLDMDSFQEPSMRNSMKYDSDLNEDGNSSSSLSSRSSLSRDCIGDLLQQLSLTLSSSTNNSNNNNNGQSASISSSIYQNSQRKRNSAQSVSNQRYNIALAEETMIALLTNQRFQELNYCEQSDDMEKVVLSLGGGIEISAGDESASIKRASSNITSSSVASVASGVGGDQQQQQQSGPGDSCKQLRQLITFEQCRQLIQQLGYLSWEKRCKIDSLTKSTRLVRELKNLDAQLGRETHKIAVIYVAHGQEDKNSILMNSTGSRAFEDFVSGLGWEVNLASHLGFRGGLQSNKSTGETSPYYCNGSTEVMFHVSTRIPLNNTKPADDESLNKKLRHLGNDEIHIVWSEHTRDYRRGIIPTEFGDVIIVIYPMLTFQGYYRISISSKQDVPMFGPLFNNCIVHQTSLAPLIRATAINASRAKRLKLPYYQSHFDERSRLIDLIVQNHKEKLSFEEFAMQLYDSTGKQQATATSQSNSSSSVTNPSNPINSNSPPGGNRQDSTTRTISCN